MESSKRASTSGDSVGALSCNRLKIALIFMTLDRMIPRPAGDVPVNQEQIAEDQVPGHWLRHVHAATAASSHFLFSTSVYYTHLLRHARVNSHATLRKNKYVLTSKVQSGGWGQRSTKMVFNYTFPSGMRKRFLYFILCKMYLQHFWHVSYLPADNSDKFKEKW